MFDTYVTVVGNVLSAPQWRRTTQTNTLVANFKVASTSRRLDRERNRWVDGNSLRVRVNCWRKLAEGVASSVMVGDPVVVVGRLYTRDWIDGDGNHRTLYELDAIAVGHDLSRGRARFARNRPSIPTSTVEDEEADTRVQGETTVPVPDEQAPVRRGEHPFDDDDPLFPSSPLPAPVAGRAVGGGNATAPRSSAADPGPTLEADPGGASAGEADWGDSTGSENAVPEAAGQYRDEPGVIGPTSPE